MNARSHFNGVVSRVLSSNNPSGATRRAANELFQLLNELGGNPHDVIGPEATAWQTETLLCQGKAINPYSAAMCIVDYQRTIAFSRGVCEAVRTSLEQGIRPVQVLYAGTGPFAPLALLQTAEFSPDEVRFTLIDLHERSLQCVLKIVDTLGLKDYVECVHQADVITWRPPRHQTYDVIVAEVMERALTNEPQVAVTRNLARWLHPEGHFVPESVALSLCLYDPATEFHLKSRLEPLGAVVTFRAERILNNALFELSAASASTLAVEDANIWLPDICLPAELEPRHRLGIMTRIRTFEDIALVDYDCGLTIPQPVTDDLPLRPAMRLHVCYEMSQFPGLRFSVP